MLAVLAIPPVRTVFGVANLNSTEYLEILLLAIIPLVLTELVKLGTWLVHKMRSGK